MRNAVESLFRHSICLFTHRESPVRVRQSPPIKIPRSRCTAIDLLLYPLFLPHAADNFPAYAVKYWGILGLPLCGLFKRSASRSPHPRSASGPTAAADRGPGPVHLRRHMGMTPSAAPEMLRIIRYRGRFWAERPVKAAESRIWTNGFQTPCVLRKERPKPLNSRGTGHVPDVSKSGKAGRAPFYNGLSDLHAHPFRIADVFPAIIFIEA